MKKLAILAAVGVAYGSTAFGSDPAPASKGPVAAPATPPEPAIECLTYDYFDIQYIYTRFDSHEIKNGHGAGFDFSTGLGNAFYLSGGADWTQTKVWDEDTDLWGAELGVGYFIPLADTFHFTIEGGATYSDIDGLGSSWGGYVGPGFRMCAYQGLEIFGNALWHNLDKGGSRWNFEIGGVFDLTEMVGVKISGVFNDDRRSVLAGLRIYY